MPPERQRKFELPSAILLKGLRNACLLGSMLLLIQTQVAFGQFVDLPLLESEKPESTKDTPKSTKENPELEEPRLESLQPKSELPKLNSNSMKLGQSQPFDQFEDAFVINHPEVTSELTDALPANQKNDDKNEKTGQLLRNRNSGIITPAASSGVAAEKNATENSLPPKANSNPANRVQALEESTFRLSSANQNKPFVPYKPIPANRSFQELPSGNPSKAPTIAKRSTIIRKAIRPPTNQFVPWWIEKVSQSKKESAQRISVDQLVLSMLRHSPEIRALSQDPMIASTLIETENAKFDPVSFLESKWEDTSEPVGNILTTNNSPFLKDHIVTAKGGFRKKSQVGTEFELAQSIGFKNSNSEFFQPQDQGTSRLVLNVNQPLLNGAGKLVGTSRIVLAEIDARVAGDQYAEQLQEKIVSLIKAYWELHYQKSVFVLREKNYQSALEILHQLKGRESFDAQRSQVIRAEAAVAARKLDLIRSRTDVKNAETVIRELTRDRSLGPLGLAHHIELLPAEHPSVNPDLYPSLAAVVAVAYQNRPEIDQAMNRLKAASIQYDVSKNQLLPQLSLVLKAYAAALNGDSGIEQALQRQFASTTPGYSAGLVFEYPIYNRAAQARKQRVEAEMTKLAAKLEDTMGNITAEVEIAYREQKLALESTAESLTSIKTSEKDQAFIKKRWENSAFLESQDFSSPTIFLEQLLDSQDRITQAQIQYANATRQFMVASAEIRKAEGSLLNYQSLDDVSTDEIAPQPEMSTAPLTDDIPNRNSK